MNIDRDKLIEMKLYERYNWKNQPERLIYIGKKGSWHQFVKVDQPETVWCEVLDSDLHMLEPTVSAHAITSMQTEPNDDAKRAIEHAEYLAKGAEILLNYLNDMSDEEEGTINPDDNFADFTGSLRNYVYEFRKRAERFNTHPAPVTSMQGDSEPVAKVIHTKGIGLMAGKTIPKVMLDIKYADLPSGTQLYLQGDRVKGVSDSEKRMLQSYPTMARFFDKYALGGKLKPSCFMCGSNEHEPSIKHLELPDIHVCKHCVESQLPTNTDGWVSVSDRLPDLYDNYIVRLDNNTVTEMMFSFPFSPRWFKQGISEESKENKVTHWQSLPAPPAISQDKGESV